MTGIELITQERKEQFTKHGRSIERDISENSAYQLSHGAATLAYPIVDDLTIESPPEGWDETIWGKMCNKPHRERLIIAGALIAAEIDRLNETEKL